MTERKNKPRVKYMGHADIVIATTHDGGIYRYANLYAINHPKLGTRDVRTSVILWVTDDGVIETMNTIYEPTLEMPNDDTSCVD